MPSFLQAVDADSWLFLITIFILFSLTALLGKITWGKQFARDAVADDELKIVLGATLSLFGLLIGFILSFAISGYNTRDAAEENEAIAIGNAFQHVTLLEDQHRARAKELLTRYLDLRIAFFSTTDDDERARTRMASIRAQTHMWQLISKIARDRPDAIIASALAACSDLYTAQQKTMSSWRRQTPEAAWAILIVFGLCSNFLIGYNIRGKRGSSWMLLVVPAITSLTLFMIAEIDVPGKGMIDVVPNNLRAVHETMAQGGLAPIEFTNGNPR